MKKKRGKYLTDKQYAMVLLLPAVGILTIIGMVPLVDAVRAGFTNASLLHIYKYEFIGFKNYFTIFTSGIFWQALRNTFIIAGVSVIARFGLGLGLALCLTGIITKARNSLRGVLFLPWVIPGVAMAILWAWLLTTEGGLANYLLKSLGLIENNIPWLGDKTMAKVSIITIFIWGGTPFIMLVLVAGLQTIPKVLIEAATIDGAGYWSRFVHVIFPLVRPIMAISVLLSFIYMFQNMVIIYITTRGGPGLATETLSLFVYETAFDEARIGRACAIGTVWLMILLGFAVFYFKLMVGRKRTF